MSSAPIDLRFVRVIVRVIVRVVLELDAGPEPVADAITYLVYQHGSTPPDDT